jgi:uncharacterized protein DUF4214
LNGNNVDAWLTGLYNGLLGRTPDLVGFNHWLSNLAAGETRFQVAGEFATSVERQTIVIRQGYAAFLGRTPDATGLNTWLRPMMYVGPRSSFGNPRPNDVSTRLAMLWFDA